MSIARNHAQPFRPLMGGVAIHNPVVNSLGTLGCILKDDNGDPWILSCYHVLGRADFSDFDQQERVYQPAFAASIEPVATLAGAVADKHLDAIAVRVTAAVEVSAHILGIGMARGVAAPVEGMLVVKSGLATGVTEGVVTAVDGHMATIEPRLRYPVKYDLSSISDSGAVWMEEGTGIAVALHFGSSDFAGERAMAIPMPDVLEALGFGEDCF